MPRGLKSGLIAAGVALLAALAVVVTEDTLSGRLGTSPLIDELQFLKKELQRAQPLAPSVAATPATNAPELLHRKRHEFPRPPLYNVSQRGAEIVLDGNLREPDWSRAAWLTSTLDNQGNSHLHTLKLALLWDEEHLYVAGVCEDPEIASKFKRHDDPLWDADVLELYFDVSTANYGHYQLDISPNGVTYDNYVAFGLRDTLRAPPDDVPVVKQLGLTKDVWESGAEARTQPWREGAKRGFSVECRLRWRDLEIKNWKSRPWPLPGMKGTINFSYYDGGASGNAERRHYSLMPTFVDFWPHVPDACTEYVLAGASPGHAASGNVNP